MEVLALDLSCDLELVLDNGDHVVHDMARGGGSTLLFARHEHKVHSAFGNAYALTEEQSRRVDEWFKEYEA